MKLNVRLLTLTSLTSLISLSVQAQVKIGQDAAPAKGAVLELNSATGAGNYIGGLRLPNVSITDLNAIPEGFTENALTSTEKTALTGMIVYNTNTTTGIGIYYWDGVKWVKGSPTDLTKRDIVTGVSSATATAPLVLANNTAQTVGTANPSFTVNNTAPLWNANQLQGKTVHTTAPTDGQVLKWDNANSRWAPAADTNTTYTISAGAGAGAVTLTPSSGTAQTITINVNDADNIVGNEVTDAANGTLVRSGGGTAASPYKLERAAISGDVTIAAASNAATVTGIQGKNVATTAPTNGQVLKWNGTTWAPAADDNTIPNAWLTTGNAGLNNANNFIGTTDDVALMFRINNKHAGRLGTSNNITSFGVGALATNAGAGGTAFGVNALTVNTGGNNTAFGYNTLAANTSGTNNTAVGYQALTENTGASNTAVGNLALTANTTGTGNIALGGSTLLTNTTGSQNTAIGASALNKNLIGMGNTGVGHSALFSNTGSQNTAVGDSAMFYNIGSGNTALGYRALRSATTTTAAAGRNVALGDSALLGITTGQRNIAIGNSAGTAITSGQNNIVIGTNASVPTATSSNQISIANLINATGATGVLTNNLGAGNVGIGTIAPATRFHLSGETSASSSLTMQLPSGEDHPYLRMVNAGTNNTIGALVFGRTTTMTLPTANAVISTFSTGGNNGQLRFATRRGTANAATQMTIDSTGYVGINTTAPAERLHVSGTAYVSGDSWIGTTSAGNLGVGVGQGVAPISRVHIAGANQANSSLTMHSTSGSSYPMLRIANAGTSTTLGMLAFGRTNDFSGTAASHAYIYANAPTANRLVGNMYFGTSAATRMMIDTVGYVGINTTTPAVRFHIATGGTTTTPVVGFRLTDGNHTVANRVLATDGTAGNAIESRKGISPLRSHGTGRDSLPSSGSSC